MIPPLLPSIIADVDFGNALAEINRGSLLMRLAAAIIVLMLAGLTVRVLTRVVLRRYWQRVTNVSPEQSMEIRRSKRQQTIATLLNSLVRYVVFGAALIAVVGIVFQDAGSALFGASLVVVIVGFGLQRLFGDVVAGMLLLFEGHFGVGDFLHVHSQNVGGIVEEFSLRTTTLRAFNGDRITVLNGSIVGFTTVAEGYRDFVVEFFVSDPVGAGVAVDRVTNRLEASTCAEYLYGPTVLDTEPADALGLYRMRMRAVVPPSLDYLAETELPAHLERELGELLDGPVTVHEAQDTAFQAYRRTVLVKQ